MSFRFDSTTGKRVRLLRADRGLKQGELADLINIRGPYLSLIENDRAQPSAEVIARLARALGTTTDYLLLMSHSPERPAAGEPATEVAREPVYA